ncbi:MAG: endonuclease/exonuclease/phosphatase family protein [Bacteroidota bacterium]
MKRFLSISFSVASVLLAIVYGLSCFTPYISPARFWVMGFLGLAFPVLLLTVLVTALVWLFIKRKSGLALLVLIFAGYQNISVLFAWNKNKPFASQKQVGTVRILSWNIKGFDTHEFSRDSANSLRHKMLRFITQQDAEILCLQDFTEYNNPALPSNVAYLKDSMHYPYHYFTADYKSYPPWGPAYSGIAIFSKYPLNRVEQVVFPGKKTPESIIVADITIRNIKRRFIVTHLQSMHLRDLKPKDKEPWDNTEDSAIIYSDNKFKKLKFFLPYHALQAQQVQKQIDESPYPIIFSADMNEVPTSYVYHRIRGKLKDVFLMNGFGLGRTYYSISPTLRIDHLFVSPSVEVVQYKKDDIFMSDHYPQVMDVKW